MLKMPARQFRDPIIVLVFVIIGDGFFHVPNFYAYFTIEAVSLEVGDGIIKDIYDPWLDTLDYAGLASVAVRKSRA